MSTTLNSKQDKAPFPGPCKSQGTVGSNLEDEETPRGQENFEFEGSGLSLPAGSSPLYIVNSTYEEGEKNQPAAQ